MQAKERKKAVLLPQFTHEPERGLLGEEAREDAELYYRRYVRENAQGRLAFASFDECRFESGRFLGVFFENVHFTNVEFENCDFSNATFRDCGFHKVRFAGCKLVGTTFTKCYLSEWTVAAAKADDLLLDDCKLKSALIADSSLKRARLFRVPHKNFCLERDDLECLEAGEFSFAGMDLSSCALTALRVVPESLAGARIDPLQAADLIGLFGLKLKTD